MVKKSFQYWGVYETGVTATPKGSKRIIEEMAGLLSKPDSAGRKVCIQKGPRGFGTLGETTGVCYINGVREVKRKPRPARPQLSTTPEAVAAPTLAAPELPGEKPTE